MNTDNIELPLPVKEWLEKVIFENMPYVYDDDAHCMGIDAKRHIAITYATLMYNNIKGSAKSLIHNLLESNKFWMERADTLRDKINALKEQQEKEKREHAVGFLDWVTDSDLRRDSRGNWYDTPLYQHEGRFGLQLATSTDQLYEIWLQSKQTKQP